jgi:hypothetical protein
MLCGGETAEKITHSSLQSLRLPASASRALPEQNKLCNFERCFSDGQIQQNTLDRSCRQELVQCITRQSSDHKTPFATKTKRISTDF